MDNNVNNGAVAPAPAKKSHAGLIIGLIVLLLVVIGGFLAAFFLWIKPTFIDGGGSGGDEEEEKSVAEIYGAYVKKNYEDEDVELVLIDFNNDETPDLVVKDGTKILEVATINKKDKVKSVEVNKAGKVDLFFDVDGGKEKWFFVYEGYSSYEFYDLNKTIENESLPSAETFDSETAAKKKYISMEAELKYEDVEAEKATKALKTLAKEDKNYRTEKTVSDIKTEIENMNKEHKLLCSGDSEGVTINYEISFKNNVIDSFTFSFELEPEEELTAEQEEAFKQAFKTQYPTADITITKQSNKKYLIVFKVGADYLKDTLGITQADLEDATYDNVDELIKEFKANGATCRVE